MVRRGANGDGKSESESKVESRKTVVSFSRWSGSFSPGSRIGSQGLGYALGYALTLDSGFDRDRDGSRFTAHGSRLRGGKVDLDLRK